MSAHSPRRSGGFTLVEIVVALLVGLVAVIVIMQTYAVSEGFKRTSTSGSDAQSSGGVALYLVERELRMAGYGFNALAGTCNSIAIYNASSATTQSVVVWPPIQVNPAGVAAGDANTDVVLVAYGSSDDFFAPVAGYNVGTQTTDYVVTPVNYTAFRTGDIVVAYNTGGICIMTEITAGNWASGNCKGQSKSGAFNTVSHGTGAYYSNARNCAQVMPQHNPSGGVSDPAGSGVVAPLASSTGWLYNLGPSPQLKAYAIRGGNLTVCDLLQQNCAQGANFTVVMNDVVSLRAVFGQGDAFGNVTTWSRTANASTAAVAVEVTARNTLKEKPKGGGACDATAAANRPDRGTTQDWYTSLTPNDGTLGASAIDVSTVSADWKCYRYKLFQTTVPIRNAIWTPTNLNPPTPPSP